MSQQEKYIPRQNKDLNRLVVVTGVSASGKDYLLERLSDQGGIPNTIQVVSFGEELFHRLQEKHSDILSRDDIKRLSQEAIKAGILDTASKLEEAQPAVINTHTVYRQNDSLSVTPDVDLKLRPITYMYVGASPDEIIYRRTTDTSRKRPTETAEQVELHQNIAIEVVSTLARHIGSKLITVWNREDNVQENLAKMRESIEELRS